MKISPAFFAFALVVATTLAAPSGKPKAETGKATTDTVQSPCAIANKQYTLAVGSLVKILTEVKTNWVGRIPDDKWDRLTKAAKTAEELYFTTGHVDFETNSAVIPTLSKQLSMRPQIKGLYEDIEGTQLPAPSCLWDCPNFEPALDAVKDVKIALDSLSISCAGQSPTSASLEATSATETGTSTPTPTGAVSPAPTKAVSPKLTGDTDHTIVTVKSSQPNDANQSQSSETTVNQTDSSSKGAAKRN